MLKCPNEALHIEDHCFLLKEQKKESEEAILA